MIAEEYSEHLNLTFRYTVQFQSVGQLWKDIK